jgi:nicotinate-nucleotide adenylyltransferase
MGADNLINFHKWNNWSKIGKLAKILVFDRSGYKKRSKESVAYKNLKKRGLKYISFNKVNISSSQIRNI